MGKRHVFYILVGIIASSMVAPSAMAQVCLLRSSSGACLFYSGSVSCEGINVKEKSALPGVQTYITCSISAPSSISGIVFCADKKGNVSAGVSGSLAAKDFSSSRAHFTLDNKGKASGIKAHAGVSRAQLAKLNHFCPAKQTAVDFVPTAMNTTVQMVNGKGKTIPNNTANFSCSLPKPSTLGWNTKTKSPDRRQYKCKQQ